MCPPAGAGAGWAPEGLAGSLSHQDALDSHLVQLGKHQGLWIRVVLGSLAYLPREGSPLQVLKLPEELLSLVMATQQYKADSIQSWQMASVMGWTKEQIGCSAFSFLFIEF